MYVISVAAFLLLGAEIMTEQTVEFYLERNVQ